MKKLKYIRFFENFDSNFTHFDPKVIQNFNQKLYDRIKEASDDELVLGIPELIEEWIEEFSNLIKIVEPFKNITMEITNNAGWTCIIVDWNDNTWPFEIGFVSCGKIHPSTGEEYESIGIRFESSYSSYPEIENLEDGKASDATDGTFIEYKFSKGEDTNCLYIEEWNDDAIPRLFRNIEKSIIK
jgi:hypothetical protein